MECVREKARYKQIIDNIIINTVGEKYLKIKSFREGNRTWVAGPFRKLQGRY